MVFLLTSFLSSFSSHFLHADVTDPEQSPALKTRGSGRASLSLSLALLERSIEGEKNRGSGRNDDWAAKRRRCVTPQIPLFKLFGTAAALSESLLPTPEEGALAEDVEEKASMVEMAVPDAAPTTEHEDGEKASIEVSELFPSCLTSLCLWLPRIHSVRLLSF